MAAPRGEALRDTAPCQRWPIRVVLLAGAMRSHPFASLSGCNAGVSTNPRVAFHGRPAGQLDAKFRTPGNETEREGTAIYEAGALTGGKL